MEDALPLRRHQNVQARRRPLNPGHVHDRYVAADRRVSSHSYQAEADIAARRVSRNGGAAHVTYKDPESGIETPVSAYAPYEVAMEEMVDDVNPDR